MSYLGDYIHYASGTECPEDYLYWSGLSILGHVMGNKVWITHGDHFRFHPNLYICLVGDAGSGKNTALGLPIEIMLEHFTNHMLSASIQSREDIADLMSSEDCCHTWKDDEGWLGTPRIREYRPFYVINNELASFLSVDKMKMVEFLTEVYDGKRFSTGFKGQRRDDPTRQQWFDNPHLSLIAGAVPTWFMASLKLDLFSGGLGRRMIIVHTNRTKVVPDPRRPPGADEALRRVVSHLKAASLYKGPLVRTPDAMKWWTEWYEKNRNRVPEDPILNQFHQTKHMQLLKIACVLRMTEYPFKRTVEADHLQMALHLLEKLEPAIVKLTCGIGRNELAGVAAELLNTLSVAGGVMLEKKLQGNFFRHLRPPEFEEVLGHLSKTDQIVRAMTKNGEPQRKLVFLPEQFKAFEKGELKL